MLPKIHKVNIPGKPVISSVFSHTIEISRFINYHLQPNAIELRSSILKILKISSTRSHLN